MTLDVLLHGRRVGTLVREPAGTVISFVADADYMADGERDVLGQQFEDRRSHRVFRQRAHPGQLPSFFANLLPEGALLAIVQAQVAERDDLSTLARVGEDLPGAVVVRPRESPADTAPASGEAFDEPGLHDAPVSAEPWRFSLAGVQLKFSAVRDPQNRFTLPFEGRNGSWILKFGSPQYRMLPENELWTMQWARSSGLSVPECEIVPARSINGLDPRFLDLGENVFAIRRYDRLPDGTRVHQEDLAQVRGVLPEHKYAGASYEGLARLIGDLCGPDDALELLRRVVFSILAGNTDAHLKNWSLLYPDRRVARLAPAYDLVFVRCYQPSDSLALTLAKERDPARIGWEHFARMERFLHKHGLEIPVVAEARDFVDRALDAWSSHRHEVDPFYRNRLERHLAELPLAQRSS